MVQNAARTLTLTCLELLTCRDKDMASAPVALGRWDPEPGDACIIVQPLSETLAEVPMLTTPMSRTEEPSQRQGWRNSPSVSRRVCTRLLTCGERGQSELGS